MKKSILFVIFVLSLLFLIALLSPAVAKAKEDSETDSDRDGVPDYLDSSKIKKNTESSNETKNSTYMESSSYANGNWSFNYGSDYTFGAFIGDVYWNNTLYIDKAHVPWIKINNVQYNIPNDFEFIDNDCENLTNFYLAYQLYSINISDVEYSVEVLWYFWKASVNNSGKINMTVLICGNNSPTTLFVPTRVDFDIVGSNNDLIKIYGQFGWNLQTNEAFQFTSSPVDPIWGMKVRQEDSSWEGMRWGGIEAWSISETNYLLNFRWGEFNGDPINYLNMEYIYLNDDVIWTTATETGSSPVYCGPTIFLH
jgi:hypothetical protein